MRVVSMVPSWTETLLEAGVDVIGRTRFCIHPESRVANIPIVGGTKDWKWERILELKPDLLLLDEEENPRFMAEQSEIRFVSTHVQSVSSVSGELQKLQAALQCDLSAFAEQWQEIAMQGAPPAWTAESKLPGWIEWGKRPVNQINRIIYVIWKDPWMTVSQDTFVGSMLQYCGFGPYLNSYAEKYPKLDLENEKDKESTLLLLSSEPYPFLQKRNGLDDLGFPYAFVNGESFSWFGVRSLRFLQQLSL